MNILLTGANGFIGSFLKKKLDKEYDVKTLGISKSNDFIIDLSNVNKVKNF